MTNIYFGISLIDFNEETRSLFIHTARLFIRLTTTPPLGWRQTEA